MDLNVAAAYIRVSTDDQVEYSPESQVAKITELAKREGYVIPDDYFFRDEGISGKSADKRPAFRLMIATAKQNPPPFDRIYVWEFSRFARNQEEWSHLQKCAEKAGHCRPQRAGAADDKSVFRPNRADHRVDG